MQCQCTVVYAWVDDESSTSRKPKFTHEVSRNVDLFKLDTIQSSRQLEWYFVCAGTLQEYQKRMKKLDQQYKERLRNAGRQYSETEQCALTHAH